jgi:predicted esterase YcpF (UPF0227 family)
MSQRVLYIHGFMSSPLSYKTQQTKQYIEKFYPDIEYYCPQLSVSPQLAIKQLESLIEQYHDDQWYILGSSLGGYYASHLAEKYQLLAVLINPAVKPYELLTDYIGVQQTYHTGETVEVKKSFMNELKLLEQTTITKKNYLVMVQTGDEVLDYQQAVEKYQGCQLIVQPNGDHSFINFQEMYPDIVRFFNLLHT